jgi:tRNA-dihydrouridine synthase B
VFQIGPYQLSSPTLLAPMAGISDLPFRRLCRRFGAAVAATEMISATLQMQRPEQSRLRSVHLEEATPRVVQIAGADPDTMAAAARLNVENGAQVIDINMGCPMKKILKQASGSALLRDEALVERILRAVAAAVDVPVTLKIRTGWSPEHRNGPQIARIAEDAGIAALAVHGRTRACMFTGHAEYDTIARIKQTVSIPVIANGDITTPQQAKRVLQATGADGIMIGRGAQGRPWIFRDINHYLQTGTELAPMSPAEITTLVLEHARAIHRHYGNHLGLGFVRKHVGWYVESAPDGREFRRRFNALTQAEAQLDLLRQELIEVLGNTESALLPGEQAA